MYCVKCGTQLEGSPKFCHVCGQPVPTEIPPATPPVAAVESAPQRPVVGKGRPVKAKRRWPRRLLTCGTIVLALIVILALAAGGAYFWFGLHRTNLAAKVVPADTGALVMIRPNLLQVANARQVEDLFNWAVVAAALPGISNMASALDDNDLLDLRINARQDLLPWIGGEIGLAILYGEEGIEYGGSPGGGLAAPAERPMARYGGPPFILTVATRSEKRSDLFLADLRAQWEKKEVRFDEWTYGGFGIAEMVSDEHPPLAFATVDRVVMVASDAETLKSAIDRATGRVGRILNDEQQFRMLLKELPGNRLGTLYLDWDIMREYLGVSEDEIPFGIARGVEMAAIAPSLTRDGLRFDYVLSYNVRQLDAVERELLGQTLREPRLATAAPIDSAAFVSGPNLITSWDLFWLNMERNLGPVERDLLREIDPRISQGEAEGQLLTLIERETGVELRANLLDKLTGEYALALVPVADGTFDEERLPVALVLLAEIEDRSQVERTMHDLTSAIARNLRLDFYRDAVRGMDVWMTEDRYGANPFGYGFADDILFMASSREALELIVDAQDDPLAEGELFREAVRPLPESGWRGWYVDVEAMLDIMSLLMDEDEWREFDKAVGQEIESLRAISVGAGPLDNNGLMRGVVSVCMDPR